MSDEVTAHKMQVWQHEVQKLTLMHAVTSAYWRGYDEQAGEHVCNYRAHQQPDPYNIGRLPERGTRLAAHFRRTDGSGLAAPIFV
jgi:hypothetical protein